jgi:hypothetical protein
VQKEVIDKIAALITAAFGLITALAQAAAIQAVFQLIFGQQSGVWAMIFYAVIVTITAVVVTIIIERQGRCEILCSCSLTATTHLICFLRRKFPLI